MKSNTSFPLSVYFLIFLAVNALLTYSSFSFTVKFCLVLGGLFIPFLGALKTRASSKTTPPIYEKELLKAPSPWLWLFLISLLAFSRFYKLDNLFRWPTLDEGWNGILALQLSRHWDWRFFYTFGQAPPLPVWSAAFLLKLGFSPFLCLWLPSAMVSLWTAVVGYFAAREFFSKSFSLLCGGLLAFSYWPLYLGRFCHQGIWLPLWICACLFLMGRFRNSSKQGERNLWAAVWGAGVGLGSFTFTPWVAGAALFGMTALGTALSNLKKNLVPFLCFCFALLASLFPFLAAAVKEGYGQHIQSLTPWSGWASPSNQGWVVLGYLSSFFWGPLQEGSAYTPTGGGFLNPLLSSFFFLGLLETRLRKDSLLKWLLPAFLIFLLPGFLSANVETFRIAQVMPLLLLFTALGMQTLLAAIPWDKRVVVLFGVLALSFGWDGYRLMKPYQENASRAGFGQAWPVKSLERYRTYKELESIGRARGPGWVLTDFDEDSFNDPTLSLAVHPFNLADNEKLRPGKPPWVAVFVNAHYAPFLSRRFADSKWFEVGKDLRSDEGGQVLGIIPILNGNVEILRRWAQAHAFFQEADFRRFWQNKEDFTEVLSVLQKAYPLVKGDPFLESVYWEKTAAYEYGIPDYEGHLHALRSAVVEGYPAAHLYYKLGLLLMTKDHLPEARQAFQKASASAFNRTPSEAMLRRVAELEKGNLTLRDLYRPPH